MEATEHVSVNIQMIMYGAEFANSLWSQLSKEEYHSRGALDAKIGGNILIGRMRNRQGLKAKILRVKKKV